MEAEISLIIMSPENVLDECAVSLVRLPGKGGAFEVLKDHAPLITALDAGNVEYVTSDGQQKSVTVKSGFAEIRKNKVSVCVEL